MIVTCVVVVFSLMMCRLLLHESRQVSSCSVSGSVKTSRRPALHHLTASRRAVCQRLRSIHPTRCRRRSSGTTTLSSAVRPHAVARQSQRCRRRLTTLADRPRPAYVPSDDQSLFLRARRPTTEQQEAQT